MECLQFTIWRCGPFPDPAWTWDACAPGCPFFPWSAYYMLTLLLYKFSKKIICRVHNRTIQKLVLEQGPHERRLPLPQIMTYALPLWEEAGAPPECSGGHLSRPWAFLIAHWPYTGKCVILLFTSYLCSLLMQLLFLITRWGTSAQSWRTVSDLGRRYLVPPNGLYQLL